MEYIRQGGERASAIVQDLLTSGAKGRSDKRDRRSEFHHRRIPGFAGVREDLLLPPRCSGRNRSSAGLLNIKGSPVHLRKTVMNLSPTRPRRCRRREASRSSTRNLYLDRPVPRATTMSRRGITSSLRFRHGRGDRGKRLKTDLRALLHEESHGEKRDGAGAGRGLGDGQGSHGYINVQSEEGKGTTFTLYFPVTREEASREGDHAGR